MVAYWHRHVVRLCVCNIVHCIVALSLRVCVQG